jgi:hypothetical protein
MDFKTLALESRKYAHKTVSDDYVLVNGKYQLRSDLERSKAFNREEEQRLSVALDRLKQLRQGFNK